MRSFRQVGRRNNRLPRAMANVKAITMIGMALLGLALWWLLYLLVKLALGL